MCRRCAAHGISNEMVHPIGTGQSFETHLNMTTGPPDAERRNSLALPDWKRGRPRPANWPPHIYASRCIADAALTIKRRSTYA